MKTLWTIIKNNLKEGENIYILRKDELSKSKGIMKEFTFDQIFNTYSGSERVIEYWHEDGLCIIIK